MDQMQLRLQPSGAQLGHVPSAPMTEVQRLGKQGPHQLQSTPADVALSVAKAHQEAEAKPDNAYSAIPTAAEAIPATTAGGDVSSSKSEPIKLPHPLDRSPDDPSLVPDETEFETAKIQYEWQGHIVDCEAAYQNGTPKRVIDAIGVCLFDPH